VWQTFRRSEAQASRPPGRFGLASPALHADLPKCCHSVKLHLSNSLPQNSANKHKPSTAVGPWGTKTVAGLKCRF